MFHAVMVKAIFKWTVKSLPPNQDGDGSVCLEFEKSEYSGVKLLKLSSKFLV